jgi:ABC-2 type transport system permease protein
VSEIALSPSKSDFKYFRSPKNLVRRLVIKRTLKTSLIFSLVCGLYMYIKASSFLTTYPTAISREKLAQTLGSNVGIEALLGVAHHLETVTGYVTWNFLCLVAAGGAIWALLLAAKMFRGEEDTGRQELVLAGQTTARGAAINVLIGLSVNLMIIYLVMSSAIIAISKLPGANFTISSSLFLGLALIAGIAEFLAVGALASQLMPIRGRAVGLATGVFGVFYMIRLIADTTSASWLLNLSPLGWIEKLQPMYNSQPIWLLPIAGFILIICGITIFLAGRRDLGEGILANKDTAKTHKRLLRSPLGIAIRMNRTMILGWLITVGLAAFVYGQLAKSAVVKTFSQSKAAERALNRIAQETHVNTITPTAFLGITFFLIMIMTMFFVASLIGRIREDEAEGYLDNFLVGPVSRIRWLFGRILLIIGSVVSVGLVSSLATWAGETSQHAGVGIHPLLLAGANAMAPGLFILGLGIFIFGHIPRLTSVFCYGAIAWSFLMVMLSSGLNLNHWIMDTSILYHISFAPAVNANWGTDLTIIIIGLVLLLVGALRFNTRDLQGE